MIIFAHPSVRQARTGLILFNILFNCLFYCATHKTTFNLHKILVTVISNSWANSMKISETRYGRHFKTLGIQYTKQFLRTFLEQTTHLWKISAKSIFSRAISCKKGQISYKPEKPLHMRITELSFYQILKHNSNNDIRNGKLHYVNFDHKTKQVQNDKGPPLYIK